MSSIVYLPEGYEPSDDEPFMNDKQLEYFRRRLVGWREELLEESRVTIEEMQSNSFYPVDATDRATEESARALLLRTRDRQRKLVAKINGALKRVENRSFGYCVATGRQISLKRLMARPIATLCLEAQEKHERSERVFRDD